MHLSFGNFSVRYTPLRMLPTSPCLMRLWTIGIIATLRAVDLFYKMIVMPPSTLGSLELAALLAVARLKDSAYGLAIRGDLAERTGRDYSVGAVYTTLQRLEDKGFVTSRHSDPLPVRGGRSRRQFSLTGAGARALRDADRHATSIWAGVGRPLRPRLA